MGAPRREISLLVCGLSLLAAACSGSGAQTGPAPPATHSPPPLARGEFTSEILLTGEVQAVRSIEIKAPQTSLFQMRIQYMAEEGSEVRKGDPLLDFDNSALASSARELDTQILDAETQIVARRAELASALKDLEIELAEKRYEHERAKLDASVDPEVLSRKEYADRELALTKAERELAETEERIALTRSRGEADLDVLRINRDKLRKDLLLAQEELGRLSIRAPADGLVVYETRPRSTLRFQEGDSCWPGQTVLSLPDLSEMQAVFWVNEVDAPRLEPGMAVEIKLDAFPDRQLAGRIVHIPSMAVKRDEDSRIAVFKVLAELDETWAGEMKPGMSVLGRIALERLEDAPLVARRAVVCDGGRYWFRDPAAGEGAAPVAFEPLMRNATHYLVDEKTFVALGGGAQGPRDEPRAGRGSRS